MVTPVFRSTYSIGKSVLTIDKDSEASGADSIIEICLNNGIKDVILVEDNLTSFMKAFKACRDNGLNLMYGVRLTFCNDLSIEDSSSDHQSIIFARDDEGCRLLNKIYSLAFVEGNGKIDYASLKTYWDNDHLLFIVPFYDSFIHNNNFFLKNCIPDLNGLNARFWFEDNNLPFDHLLKKKIAQYTNGKHNMSQVKTVCYKNKEDVEAFQTYKILCNRGFGRLATLSSPNLNHFGSDEFSMESFNTQIAK